MRIIIKSNKCLNPSLDCLEHEFHNDKSEWTNSNDLLFLGSNGVCHADKSKVDKWFNLATSIFKFCRDGYRDLLWILIGDKILDKVYKFV